MLCFAYLKRVVDIVHHVFQFIFNIILKKEIFTEALIEFMKQFPVLCDLRVAVYKYNEKR